MTDLMDTGNDITHYLEAITNEGDPYDPTAKFLSQMGTQELLFTAEDHLKSMIERNKMRGESVDLARYQPLALALEDDDWKVIRDFLKKDPEALHTKITEAGETFLHSILGSDHEEAIRIIEETLPVIGGDLSQRDAYGHTILFAAATVGNTRAAKIFVSLNPNLPNMRNDVNLLPIHVAATWGHKEMVEYLLSVTKAETSNGDPSPFAGFSGVMLLILLINSNLYGIAFGLLKRYPDLAREENAYRQSVLQMLAQKPQGFASGIRLGYWQSLIYNRIPLKREHIPSSQTNPKVGDTENPIERSRSPGAKSTAIGFLGFRGQIASSLRKELHIMLWKCLMHLVPGIKSIHNTKITNMQTVEMVRMMCEGVIWNFEEASKTLKEPFLTAAKSGISEIVREIKRVYSCSICFVDNDGNSIFQIAVSNRREKVFNLLYKMGPMKDYLGMVNKSRENILHLAGKLAPSSQIAGAALQMQRELQWFKAVENLVQPTDREKPNPEGQTPRELFTIKHKDLVKEGEKWMKETAQSCTVVAALIITVVFAAAFTVPGGNDSGGIPNFLHKPSFIVFAISDALGLFSSTASLLMFLGILTSRYSEKDFLESLPKRLIIGLITLFLSIACMMVAFGATIYIFLSHPWKWTIFPISLLGFLPVTLFALLQFPLLVEMFSSTYGPSIFSTNQVK